MHGVEMAREEHRAPKAFTRDRAQRHRRRRIASLTGLHDPRGLRITGDFRHLCAERFEPRSNDLSETRKALFVSRARRNRNPLREVALHRVSSRGECVHKPTFDCIKHVLLHR
jgi:hypothetical protein